MNYIEKAAERLLELNNDGENWDLEGIKEVLYTLKVHAEENEAKHCFDTFYSYCIVPEKPQYFEFGRLLVSRLQDLAHFREIREGE